MQTLFYLSKDDIAEFYTVKIWWNGLRFTINEYSDFVEKISLKNKLWYKDGITGFEQTDIAVIDYSSFVSSCSCCL